MPLPFRSLPLRSLPFRSLGAGLAGLAATAMLAGCSSKGEIVVDEGVGITAIRTSCPAVGIPDYTGDVTLFRDPSVHDASGIDVVAAMTDVRSVCDQAGRKDARASRRHPHAGELVHTNVSFMVEGRRTDPHGERDVTLPWFITVLRAGTEVVSKRIGTVNLHFADGQLRAQAAAKGLAIIDKSEATLDPAIRDRITKRRKAGEADAAIDPLADPNVKAAVTRATFEVLVGFQLDDRQLAYNATK